MRRVLQVLVGGALVVGALQQPAAAAMTVEVQPRAVVHDGVLTLRVAVACERGSEIVEAGLTVSQDDQSLFTQAGIGPLRCDGRSHRYRVHATPFEGSFHPGVAYVSAFVITEDDSAGHTVPDVAVHGN